MNGPLVTIYIREPFAEEILISEEVTPTELMSDIGGLMGLFMGCSFVSAVEIVYHILKVSKLGLTQWKLNSFEIKFLLSQLNWDSQQGRDRATLGRNKKFFLIGPILFLYYEESLVSSNLNSNLLTT